MNRCTACGRLAGPGSPLTPATGLENMPGRVDVWHPFCLAVVRNHAIAPADAARIIRAHVGS